MPSTTWKRAKRLCGLRKVGIGCLILLCFIRLGPSVADQVTPQLTFDVVNVRQEGVVSFSILSLGPEVRSDFPEPRFLVGQTDDQSFRLHVDVDSIQQIRFNAFTFTAYLSEAGSLSKTYKFQVTGNPTGSFRDSPVKVSFRVKNGSSNVTGGILMPVYNATKTNLLLPEEQKEPVYISVSGTNPVQIHLANVADALAISLTEVNVSAHCPSCWTRISSPVDGKNPLQIDPGTTATLPIDLVCNSIPALIQGALMIKPDVPHETLTLTVVYHTVPGGADRKQTISVDVRFGPGLLGLALALVGGIVLGLAARYLLSGTLGVEHERAFHAVLSAFVLALIAEFIGIMLTTYGNSKLVLFGLDIDPRQLLPAFILAILVSGGPAVVSWMRTLFGRSTQ
jgi:hypothetical protein